MKISFSFALCASLVLAACGNGSGNTSVKLVTDTLNKTEATYTLNLKIPQVKGLKDATVQKDINDRLKKMVADLQSEFLKEIADIVIENDSTKSGLQTEFHAATLSEQMISLTIEAAPYLSGSAHPNHVTVGFTYDVDGKKVITPEEFFNTKSKYLERLSELSIMQLIAESKKKGTYYEAKEQMIRQGAGPKAENFRVFTIQNGNLVLTFDPYQVGPYAEGVQTITLSRAQITDVLSNYGRKLLSETEKED